MFNNFKVKEELKKQRYKQADLANYLGIPASTLPTKSAPTSAALV